MASTVFHLHVLALDFCPYTCTSRGLTLRKWWISWMTHRQIWIVHNGRFSPCAEKTRGGWPIVKTGNRRRSIVLPANLLHLSKLSYYLEFKFFLYLNQAVRNTVVTLSDFFWYLRSKLRPPSLNSFARELILSDIRHNDVTKYLCNDAMRYF